MDLVEFVLKVKPNANWNQRVLVKNLMNYLILKNILH